MTETELVALRDKAFARLNDALGDKPLPTYHVDGRSFMWNEYIKMLQDLIKDLNNQLANLPYQETTVYFDSTIEGYVYREDRNII